MLHSHSDDNKEKPNLNWRFTAIFYQSYSFAPFTILFLNFTYFIYYHYLSSVLSLVSVSVISSVLITEKAKVNN